MESAKSSTDATEQLFLEDIFQKELRSTSLSGFWQYSHDLWIVLIESGKKEVFIDFLERIAIYGKYQNTVVVWKK